MTDALSSQVEESLFENVIADAITALRQQVRDAQAARKALEPLLAEGALERIDLVDKAITALKGKDLVALGVGPRGEEIAPGLEQRLQAMRHNARTSLLAGLQRAAQAREIAPSLVAQQPPTMALPPLAVEMDLDAGKATLLYARYPVLDVPLDPEAILDGRERAMERIRGEAIPSEDFFAALRQAYRMALVRAGLRPGERVDLVDLIPPLAMLRVEPKRLRRRGVSSLAEYPRYLLAYQLHRLRREGKLVHAGARVELGTATGGSARNKSNVLFVPTSVTEGQYYLSVRVVPT